MAPRAGRRAGGSSLLRGARGGDDRIVPRAEESLHHLLWHSSTGLRDLGAHNVLAERFDLHPHRTSAPERDRGTRRPHTGSASPLRRPGEPDRHTGAHTVGFPRDIPAAQAQPPYQGARPFAFVAERLGRSLDRDEGCDLARGGPRPALSHGVGGTVSRPRPHNLPDVLRDPGYARGPGPLAPGPDTCPRTGG